ncbi:helix-turn-helix domain-containing protein [Roseobacter litoralis]|uniref:helix-turn-helix domain-containing protein n=1 Tax=Roseobacter litoralis TaxID=42443 RepID=UPI0024957436|nr:helix-turn-helix domain-containing protein [Roseobacter litoralis]
MTTIATIFEANMTEITVTDPSSLGAALRKARKALKISQEDLSLQTGISRTTIRAIEQGKQTAHVGLVLQLCRDLGLTIVVTTPDSMDRL